MQVLPPVSFPSERTKQLLLSKYQKSLFGSKNYGVFNKSVFSLFAHLLSEGASSLNIFTSYTSLIAIKTIYIENDRPENLLSAYIEIDLMEKAKAEAGDNSFENLKVLAYRIIPLAYHRNIRVVEILYEKTMSFFYPSILKDCPLLEESSFEGEDLEDNCFHKIFDFIKNKLNMFEGNFLHEFNTKYAELKFDVSESCVKATINVFYKQYRARKFFYDQVNFLDQYVSSHFQHFSLEKIWSEYMLSSFFRIIGQEKKAIDKLENIHKLFNMIYGPEHLENSDFLLSLGNIITPNNQQLALEYLEKTVRLRLKSLNPEHLKVAYAYMQLGSLLQGMKIFDRAMVYFQKALKGFEKHYNEDYPWDCLSYTLFSLGNIYFEQKNLDAALFYFKASWRAYNNFIIPNDIMVVTILGILNKICKELGNFVEGYAYMMQALKIIKHGFGIESEKYRMMRKEIKGQQKAKEISCLVNVAWVMDKNLRKAKIFNRKEIITDLLNHFTF